MGSEGKWTRVERRVIYGDTDAMGVMYYGNYMRFLEVGRCEFLRERGRPYAEIEASGLFMPVAEVGVKYLRPARYDDLVEIAVRVEVLRRASVRFEYRLSVLKEEGEPELLATAFSRHACYSREHERVVSLPPELSAMLADEPWPLAAEAPSAEAPAEAPSSETRV